MNNNIHTCTNTHTRRHAYTRTQASMHTRTHTRTHLHKHGLPSPVLAADDRLGLPQRISVWYMHEYYIILYYIILYYIILYYYIISFDISDGHWQTRLSRKAARAGPADPPRSLPHIHPSRSLPHIHPSRSLPHRPRSLAHIHPPRSLAHVHRSRSLPPLHPSRSPALAGPGEPSPPRDSERTGKGRKMPNQRTPKEGCGTRSGRNPRNVFAALIDSVAPCCDGMQPQR